jgi:hypothetical protein
MGRNCIFEHQGCVEGLSEGEVPGCFYLENR